MTNMKEKRQRVLIVTAFKKNFASIDWSTKTSIKTIKIFNYLEAATKKNSRKLVILKCGVGFGVPKLVYQKSNIFFK